MTRRTIPAALGALALLASAACSGGTSSTSHNVPAGTASTGSATSAGTGSPGTGSLSSGSPGTGSLSSESSPAGSATDSTAPISYGSSAYCHTAAGIGGLYFKIEVPQNGDAQQYQGQVDAIQNGVPPEIAGLITDLHTALVRLIDGGTAAANTAQPRISADMGRLDAWMRTHCA
jgi:hypothetical protein